MPNRKCPKGYTMINGVCSEALSSQMDVSYIDPSDSREYANCCFEHMALGNECSDMSGLWGFPPPGYVSECCKCVGGAVHDEPGGWYSYQWGCTYMCQYQVQDCCGFFNIGFGGQHAGGGGTTSGGGRGDWRKGGKIKRRRRRKR